MSEVTLDSGANSEVILTGVGGQRNERNTKWIKLFPGADLVLWVVNLTEYDLNLYDSLAQIQPEDN